MREPQRAARRQQRQKRAPEVGPQRELGEVRAQRRRIRARRESPRAPLLIFAILLIAGSIGASAATIHFHRTSNLLAAAPVGPASNAVVFVIDGATPSNLSAAPTPHIRDLERQGVSYTSAWLGQLQTAGPVSNATIATGAFPARDGVTGTEWRNSKTGLLVSPTDPQQVQLGALDQIMESQNTTPLAGLVIDHYRGAKVLSAGGTGCADADAAGSWLATYIICPVRKGNRWIPGSVTGHSLPIGAVQSQNLTVPVVQTTGPASFEGGWPLGRQDHWLADYVRDAMRSTKPVLTIVNFPEIARVSPHLSDAARGRDMRTLVAGVDADIGRLVEEVKREKRYNRTIFVLTSDQAVASLNDRSPLSSLNRAVVAAGGGTVYSVPGETTTLGLQDTLQGQPAAQAIQNEHLRGIDGVYNKVHSGSSWTYLPQYLDSDLLPSFEGTVGYELRTMASATSPDVVVVGSPGSGFVSGLGTARAATASGLGAQWDTQHIPLVIAGHGVIPGVTSDYPARLVDIAPTIAALLNLGSPSGGGVALADAMQDAPDGADKLQATGAARLRGYVVALRAREHQIQR